MQETYALFPNRCESERVLFRPPILHYKLQIAWGSLSARAFGKPLSRHSDIGNAVKHIFLVFFHHVIFCRCHAKRAILQPVTFRIFQVFAWSKPVAVRVCKTKSKASIGLYSIGVVNLSKLCVKFFKQFCGYLKQSLIKRLYKFIKIVI